MKITKSNSIVRFFYQALLTSILFIALLVSTAGCERDNDPYETEEEEYYSDSTGMGSTGGRVVSLDDSLDGDNDDGDYEDGDDDYDDDEDDDDDYDDDDDDDDDDDYDDDSDSTGLGG